MHLSAEPTTIAGCRNQQGSAAIAILVVMFAIAGMSYFAVANHFIMTDKGIKVYQKEYLGLSDTYVDMRQLSVQEAFRHKEVVSVMADSGDLKLVPGGDTIEKMTRAGISLSQAVRKFDREYHVSGSACEIGRITKEKYTTLDKQYDFKGKAKQANEKIKSGAKKVNQWLENQ